MRKFSKFRKFNDNNTDNKTWRVNQAFGPSTETISAPTARGTSEWTVRQYGNKLNLAPIALHLDPTKEAIEVAQPYPIINANNPTLERKYNGVTNTNGLILNDIMINPHSNLTAEFDSGKLDIKLAYQYLNMGHGLGVQPYHATNFQYQSAFDDGRSRVAAELWTTSSFNTSRFESSMPQMETSMTSALVHYQTVLQNYATVMAKFNQLTLLQQDLINMGYGRESSILVELFSRLGKTTFMNKWFTLANDLEDEYFDKEWFAYVNAIVNVPSRKTNSTRDPLLTTVGVHEIPSVKIGLMGSDTFYYDSNKMTARSYQCVKTGNGDIGISYEEVGMEELFRRTLEMLDQNNILNWARKLYLKNDEDKFTLADHPTHYFNMLSLQIDSLIRLFREFKAAFQDMKVFLNIAKRANLIKWEQRVKFSLFKSKTTTSAVNNINIRDIVVATCASPSRMVFDNNTQKWGFYSLWDEYEGIPVFDTNNGGMDIIFSVKRDIDGTAFFNNDALELCLPFLFKHRDEKNVITMINRNSQVIYVQAKHLPGETVLNNIGLSRLIPKQGLIGDKSQNLLTIPWVTVPTSIAQDANTISAILRMLTHLFKMGNVELNQTGDIRTYVNSTLICLVDGQMQSAALETMKHIRANTPMTGIANVGK